MKPERWRQVTDVFHAARGRAAADREAFLDDACAGDTVLRAEVEGMLDADRDAGSFGEIPIVVPEQERPRLEPGTPVGPYRIEALIGSGGMGEVYRARDARLDRSVAVKVLPRRIAVDPGYKQRLAREAKALAALSHPHICPVFDIGQQDGVDYLVMEYVEGETLARRLMKGALPLSQALQCAVEIADALDKAHGQGIVHRDLKPGNIMLTKAGARLLDFGLATQRLATPLLSLTGDVTARAEPLTEQSGVMGTLQYMAPEQLAGKRADPRTDIFAFGAVVYEMVTGRKAFEGESPAKVIDAILEHEPEAVSTLSPASPPALAHLIRACLAKDPDRRWQSAGDMGRYLAWLVAEGSNARSGASVSASVHRPLRNSRFAWLAAGGLGLLLFLGVRWLARDRAAPPLVQTSMPAPPGVLLQPQVGFALSPDGRQLAFSARDRDGVGRLWLRSLDDREARPLAGTDGAVAPFWSPDGRDVGFFADQQVKRIPAAGGAVQVLASGVIEPKGGTWSPDGRIVYVPHYRTGLFEIPAQGGEARPLTTLDAAAGELSHRWPWFLPDGRSLLFLVQTAEAGAKDDRSRVEVLEPGGARHEILRANTSAAYAAPGYLLFWRTGSLYAQPFDPKRRRLGGEAKLVAPGLDLTWNEWAAFTVADAGALAYASALPWRLEWRERSGRVQQVAAPEGEYAEILPLSPDGGRLAYVAGNTAVRILDLVRGTDTRLTREGGDHDAPAWAPDGEWVAYFANKPKGAGGEIWRRRSSVLGEPEMLYSSTSVVRNLSWSPDGRWIAFEANEDILLLDLQSRMARARINTPAFEAEPNFSPDGRWLAYSSAESGRLEVYVVPAFDGPGKWQVSSGGGFTPRWAPGGSALFFHGADHNLKIVAMDLGREPKFGLAEPVFQLLGGDPWRPVYDIGPDGRILVTVQRSQSDSDGFKLILNWPRLLEPAPR